jgi:ABC-type transport system involved in multi-copper enzyme maturation permease subunit
MILRYELKKVLSKKLNRIILIGTLLAAAALSMFAVGGVSYVDREGTVHAGPASTRRLAADRSRWAGELTEDKIAQAVNSRKEIRNRYPYDIPNEEYGKTIQAYNDITDFAIDVLTPDEGWDERVLYQLEGGQAEDLYSIYEANQQKMAKEYGRTPEQRQFLEEQYSKIELPLTYAPMDSWDTILVYVETYGMILAIVVGFLAAGVFAEEFRSRADAVFFSSKYGRTKAAKSKVAAGLLIATIVYWTGMGILLLISLGIMGVSGFDTLYQIEHPYSIYVMTYGQYCLLAVLGGYIANLLAASVTMLIAAKLRSASVAVCVPFFLFCVMQFIGRALSNFLTFFKLTPDMLVNVLGCAKSINIFQIGDYVFRQIPCVMMIYFVTAVILLPFVYRSYHCYGLKKKGI